MDGNSFDDLVKEVTREAQTLTSFLDGNGYYMPQFTQGGFAEFDELPPEVEQARKKLQAAAKALHDLAAGPGEYVRSMASSYHDASTIRWLVHFRIPEAIPLRGSISYSQIASACKVNESHLRRIIRYSITNHLFQETGPNEVSHTAYSAILVTDPELRQEVEYTSDEAFPASAKLVEAHDKWMNRDEKTRTAFNLAWDTDLPRGEYYAQPDLEKGRIDRFAKSKPDPEIELQHLLAGYDWSRTKRLVDIGGSTGATAIALVRKFPSMRVMVEDFPDIIAAGEGSLEDNLPEDVRRKIFFVAHDLFTPPPDEVSGFGLYLMKNMLHRYSDEKAAQMLEHVAELLLDGGKLVMVERILPAVGAVSLEEEKECRHADLEMLELHNGKERSLEEWEALLSGVDEDLTIVSMTRPEGSVMSILEVAMKV